MDVAVVGAIVALCLFVEMQDSNESFNGGSDGFWFSVQSSCTNEIMRQIMIGAIFFRGINSQPIYELLEFRPAAIDIDVEVDECHPQLN